MMQKHNQVKQWAIPRSIFNGASVSCFTFMKYCTYGLRDLTVHQFKVKKIKCREEILLMLIQTMVSVLTISVISFIVANQIYEYTLCQNNFHVLNFAQPKITQKIETLNYLHVTRKDKFTPTPKSSSYQLGMKVKYKKNWGSEICKPRAPRLKI